ncbi:hypothetical protein SAMN02910370_00069 [Lachnospiraceae bacterium XPB1003]|nr:hypothetical protein SAMN02910370_00069 [Lachnospiraceae bacterium XPB1003]
MESENQGKSIDLRPIIYLYIYLPVLVFIIGWFKWYIGIPVLAAVLYALFYALYGSPDKKKRIDFELNGINLFSSVLILEMLFIWCLYSGQGGYVEQAGDWNKHNSVLNLLTSNSWPVRGEFEGERGVLTYYVAGYIIPALSGKIAGGFLTAQKMTFVWTMIGLFLIIHLIADGLKVKNPWVRVAIVPLFICFSSFSCLLGGVYGYAVPGDVFNPTHFMSFSIPVQFTSNIINLAWVYPQALSGWITTLLLLRNMKKVENWGLILAPAILYSAFVFVSLLFTAFVLYAWTMADTWSKNGFKAGAQPMLKKLTDRRIILAVVFLLPLALYLSTSVFQDKHGFSEMGFSFTDYQGNYKGLLIVNLMWGIWMLILLKKEKDNLVLYAASIVFFVLSLVKFGTFNDICMRGSLVPMTIFAFLVIKNVVYSGKDKWYRWLLIACLLLTASGGMRELVDLYSVRGLNFENTERGESSVEGFINMMGDGWTDLYKYQYFYWGDGGLSDTLLK